MDTKTSYTQQHAKAISSNRLINFYSNQPRIYKLNTIIEGVTYALKITDDRHMNHTMKSLWEELANNSYPKAIIRDTFQKALEKLKYTTQREDIIYGAIKIHTMNIDKTPQGRVQETMNPSQVLPPTNLNKNIIRVPYHSENTTRLMKHLRNTTKTIRTVPFNPKNNRLRHRTQKKSNKNKNTTYRYNTNKEEIKPDQWHTIIRIHCRNCRTAFITYTGRSTINHTIHQLLGKNNPLSAHIRTNDHHIDTDIESIDKIRNTKKAHKFIIAYSNKNTSENRITIPIGDILGRTAFVDNAKDDSISIKSTES